MPQTYTMYEIMYLIKFMQSINYTVKTYPVYVYYCQNVKLLARDNMLKEEQFNDLKKLYIENIHDLHVLFNNK